MYDLWVSGTGRILLPEAVIVPSCKRSLFSSLSRGICFVTHWQWRQLLWKTHNGAGIVSTDMAHPLKIMCFHQKNCNFRGDNTNRARAREACKACSLEFQSLRKALGVINKMAEKTASLLERCVSLQSPWHDKDRTWEGCTVVLYGEHAVYQLCTTRVWTGKHTEGSSSSDQTEYLTSAHGSCTAVNKNCTSQTVYSGTQFTLHHLFRTVHLRPKFMDTVAPSSLSKFLRNS